jgi:hypothetical protein
MEAERYSIIAPFVSAVKETKLHGYTIPKVSKYVFSNR